MFGLKGTVITGNDNEVITNGLVTINENKIDYVGTFEERFVKEKNLDLLEVTNGTILPGFIDAHAHFTGGSSVTKIGNTPSDALLTAAYDLQTVIDSGFTSVREMSLFGPSLSKAVNASLFKGPRIMPGGQLLSITGGHGDFDNQLPPEFVNQYSTIAYLCDGVEDCLKAARLQFRNGAKFIKICATGGVSSEVDGIDDIQFSFEEMKTIVDEAKRHGTYVASHCTGTAGTIQALKAGVTCIEHGVILDEECIDLMKEHNCSLVSTLTIPLEIGKNANYPAYMAEKMKKSGEHVLHSYQMAIEAGINIALGTDFTNTPNTSYTSLGREFKWLVECGLTPLEAIQCGTRNAAKLLHFGELVGTLQPKKYADLIVVKGNPLNDIELLAHPENIELVMMNGDILKNTIDPDQKEKLYHELQF